MKPFKRDVKEARLWGNRNLSWILSCWAWAWAWAWARTWTWTNFRFTYHTTIICIPLYTSHNLPILFSYTPYSLSTTEIKLTVEFHNSLLGYLQKVKSFLLLSCSFIFLLNFYYISMRSTLCTNKNVMRNTKRKRSWNDILLILITLEINSVLKVVAQYNPPTVTSSHGRLMCLTTVGTTTKLHK